MIITFTPTDIGPTYLRGEVAFKEEGKEAEKLMASIWDWNSVISFTPYPGRHYLPICWADELNQCGPKKIHEIVERIIHTYWAALNDRPIMVVYDSRTVV